MKRCAPLLLSLLALLAFSRPALADCFDDAAAYQGVNPHVLRAIAWFESKGDPMAMHHNTDGSVDVGQLQINSIHFRDLEKQGVPRRIVGHPCVNVYVAAWLLKQKMVRHGNTWQAVGAYHSESRRNRDAYARSIHEVLVAWGQSDPAVTR